MSSEPDITEHRPMEEWQDFLIHTSRGAAGEPFFNALARYLAHTLGMDFVCIDRLEGDGLTARTLAVWHDDKFEDNVTYALKDTPCGDVVGKEVCCFPASVCQFFPRDQVLRDLRAESYVGVTLWSHTGQAIGLIAVIGRKPLANRSKAEATLKLLAVRAAAELERLEAEAALRESEAWCRTFFEHSSDGVFCLSLNGEIVRVNQSFARLHGYSVEELLNKELKELDTPQTSQLYSERLRRILAGECLTFEVEHYHKDGHALHLEVATSLITVGGHPYGLASHRDITERKQAEEAARQSHQQVANILASISDAFFSMDDDMTVTYFNPAAERLLGRPGRDVIGRKLMDVFPEARGSIFHERYQQAIREKCSLSFETYFEVEPYRNWYDVRVYPQNEGISVYFQITTERKQAEQALRQKNAELQAALAQVKTLTGLIPICAGCKKIRDDQNFWHQVDSYIAAHTDATFTHSLCPACTKKYYPELGEP